MSRIEPLIARLHTLHPRLIDLSLDRLQRLLAQLGHPERQMPPVIHVAGTNGKGSTCAFLRAIGEAAGLRVHVYTSPHLVRFNERFRIAGRLVSDDALAAALERIEAGERRRPDHRVRGDDRRRLRAVRGAPGRSVRAGGRARRAGDATNVIIPAACAITSISLDHREMLGDTLALIAAEKAGIMKPGIPTVTGAQPAEVLAVLDAAGPVRARGREWTVGRDGAGLRYADAVGEVALPAPGLLGLHQIDNAGVAVAAIRAALPGITDFSGLARAEWPARLQLLRGRVAAQAPGREVWLDGGHNPGGGEALAAVIAGWDGPTHLLIGMKQSKDTAEFMRPLLPLAASVWAVAEPGQHQALPVERIVAASGGVARPGPTVADALHALDGTPGRVLICGSLYLAGEVLRADGVEPQ